MALESTWCPPMQLLPNVINCLNINKHRHICITFPIIVAAADKWPTLSCISLWKKTYCCWLLTIMFQPLINEAFILPVQPPSLFVMPPNCRGCNRCAMLWSEGNPRSQNCGWILRRNWWWFQNGGFHTWKPSGNSMMQKTSYLLESDILSCHPCGCGSKLTSQ